MVNALVYDYKSDFLTRVMQGELSVSDFPAYVQAYRASGDRRPFHSVLGLSASQVRRLGECDEQAGMSLLAELVRERQGRLAGQPAGKSYSPFGAEIARYRRESGVDFKDLAVILEVSNSFISNLLYGKKPVPVDLVDRLVGRVPYFHGQKDRLLQLAAASSPSVYARLERKDLLNLPHSTEISEVVRRLVREIGEAGPRIERVVPNVRAQMEEEVCAGVAALREALRHFETANCIACPR